MASEPPADAQKRDPIQLARENWERAGWGDVANGMVAVTSVMRAHQILLARVENALRPYDLSFARFELLRLLAFSRNGELPITKASDRLQVHVTSVTHAIRRRAGRNVGRGDSIVVANFSADRSQLNDWAKAIRSPSRSSYDSASVSSSARAIDCGSDGSHIREASPANSGSEEEFEQTTGVPHRSASSTGKPSPS